MTPEEIYLKFIDPDDVNKFGCHELTKDSLVELIKLAQAEQREKDVNIVEQYGRYFRVDMERLIIELLKDKE